MLFLTEQRLQEAIKAALNYDDIHIQIDEREYSEEELAIITTLILLPIEESGKFIRYEYNLEYRSICKLSTDYEFSSRTRFMFIFHQEDLDDEELKEISMERLPHPMKLITYELKDEWRKTNIKYYYNYSELMNKRDVHRIMDLLM